MSRKHVATSPTDANPGYGWWLGHARCCTSCCNSTGGMNGLRIRPCRFTSTDAEQYYLLSLHPRWSAPHQTTEPQLCLGFRIATIIFPPLSIVIAVQVGILVCSSVLF